MSNSKKGRKPNKKTVDPNKSKKEMINIIIVGIGVIIGIALGMILATSSQKGGGEKQITVAIVKEETKPVKILTTAENLADALKESKLAEGEEREQGFSITTVDGYKADETKGEWWSITKNNEEIELSANKIKIKDGEKYELTLKTER